MNRLFYIYTAPNGEEKRVTAYAEVKALVEKNGGHYKATCEPVGEENHIPARQLARRKVARQPQ